MYKRHEEIKPRETSSADNALCRHVSLDGMTPYRGRAKKPPNALFKFCKTRNGNDSTQHMDLTPYGPRETTHANNLQSKTRKRAGLRPKFPSGAKGFRRLSPHRQPGAWEKSGPRVIPVPGWRFRRVTREGKIWLWRSTRTRLSRRQSLNRPQADN